MEGVSEGVGSREGDEDTDVVDPELSGTSVGSNGFSSAACRGRQNIWVMKCFIFFNAPEGGGARRWIEEGLTPPSSTVQTFKDSLAFLDNCQKRRHHRVALQFLTRVGHMMSIT